MKDATRSGSLVVVVDWPQRAGTQSRGEPRPGRLTVGPRAVGAGVRSRVGREST
jgi:hypothetical protein